MVGAEMSDHDRDKLFDLAAEYGKLGRQQCEHCKRRDEIVDEMVKEFVRELNEKKKEK